MQKFKTPLQLFLIQKNLNLDAVELSEITGYSADHIRRVMNGEKKASKRFKKHIGLIKELMDEFGISRTKEVIKHTGELY